MDMAVSVIVTFWSLLPGLTATALSRKKVVLTVIRMLNRL